jgi:hypothetical protein
MRPPVVLVRLLENGLELNDAGSYAVITLTNQRFMIPSYITDNIYAGNGRRYDKWSILQRRWSWKK